MCIFCWLVVSLSIAIVTPTRADLAAPTCVQLKNAYDAMAQQTYTVDLPNLVRITEMLAQNHLYAKDARREAYASAEDLVQMISKLSPQDQAVWMAREFIRLEDELKRAQCAFDRRSMSVKSPSPGPLKCKAPAELPSSLLPKE